MKLNLGCGNDIITGYENIDIQPIPGCRQGDFRNLDAFQILNNSVEEIRAANVIECIPNQFLRHVLMHWSSKLQSGGILYILSNDLFILANQLTFGQKSAEETSSILFGDPNQPNQGASSLAEVIEIMKSLNMKVLSAGYADHNFFIRAEKQ